MITIGEYTQLFLSIVLGMGLIFEMPILVFFLALMGIMSPSFMVKNFRYSILVIFIIAAIVTPTPDIVNMCIFAAPMLAVIRAEHRRGLCGVSQAAQGAERETGVMSGAKAAMGSEIALVDSAGGPCVGAAWPVIRAKMPRRRKTKGKTPPAISAADAALPTLSLPPDSGPLPAFDANRAMQYVKEIVALGPRPIGSANHKKVEDYITSHLKGDTVEDDAFTADTVEGKFPVRNIIAKYPGTKDGIIVIASHYDTNYPLRNTSFIGANDGAATSALLLEFANQLRGKKRDGYSVWLLWTDAEEAMKIVVRLPTVSTVRAISRRNGSRMAPPSRSKHSCWPT